MPTQGGGDCGGGAKAVGAKAQGGPIVLTGVQMRQLCLEHGTAVDGARPEERFAADLPR